MQNKLYDVIIIRALAIVLVVAFHSYGMMYWNHFPAMTERYTDLYYVVNQYVLNFRMPLFIFISGYLFSYLEGERGKYATLCGLVKNKLHRLIIPYIVFSLLYMLTTHSFSIASLLSGSCAHFWFITMLFWCFVTTGLIRLLPSSRNIRLRLGILMGSFALLFVDLNIPKVLGIQSLPVWFFGFYLGYVVSPYRVRLYAFISKHKYLLLLFLAVYVLELVYTMEHAGTANLRTDWMRVAHLCIVLCVWYSINWLICTFPGNWLDNRVFSELNRTSYGIYVIHFWLYPFTLSNTAKQLFSMDSLAAEHTILFPLLFFIFSLMLSYIVTLLLLKTRVGRFLIG